MTDITKDSLMASLFGDPIIENTASVTVDDEKVIKEIALSDIRPFGGPYGDHFFKRREKAIEELADSIKNSGVLNAIILRKDPLDIKKYECLAGMTRCEAAELAGLSTIPARIIEVDDEDARLIMATSNRQREELFPSEKAKMYAEEYAGLKRQGERTDLTCDQVGHKLKSIDLLAEKSEDSRNQIQRYIKLTNLIPPLLDMVDEKKIGFIPGVELAYIYKAGQEHIYSIIECDGVKVSLDMAKALRELPEGTGIDGYRAVMVPEEVMVKKPKPGIKLSTTLKKKYFPASYTEEEMMNVIIDFLEEWSKNGKGQI